MDVEYKTGELVWLSREFIRTRRPSQLDFRRNGPFTVNCMVGKNAVRLILSDECPRLNPVSNVSLVMPYFHEDFPGNEKPKADKILDKEALHFLVNWVAVELILDHRRNNTIHEYLLRAAVHSGNEDNFWVPLQDISRALDPFIHQYHEIHWDHTRLDWQHFISSSRINKGLVAKTNLI